MIGSIMKTKTSGAQVPVPESETPKSTRRSKEQLVLGSGVGCRIIEGDSRVALKQFVNAASLIVTSPPYADARRSHYDSVHPDKFADWFHTFHEPFYEALKPDGSLVINIKDKVVDGVRHRYVWKMIEKLADSGWHCIEDYIWHKTNPMPGYWPNRLRDGWEYCFHLAKSPRPYFNAEAVSVPIGNWTGARLKNLSINDQSRQNSANASGFGRNISKWVGKETVLPTNVISAAVVGKNKGHPAVFPLELPLFFIRLLCPKDGLVIDPFGGSGTSGIAALRTHRNAVLIDNNPAYCRQAMTRLMEETTASASTEMFTGTTDDGREGNVGDSDGVDQFPLFGKV